MKIEYHELDGYQRVTCLILALCCILIGAMCFVTALGFDSTTAKGSYYQAIGAFDSSIVPDSYSAFDPDPFKMQSPRENASMAFVFLTGLLLIIAVNLVLIAAFSTIAFLELFFVLGCLAMALMAGISLYRVFAVGGVFGLLPLLVLAAECVVVYLLYRFLVFLDGKYGRNRFTV